MANRYEDTTQFERDVMTSMGYHWKGEGWQKATDTGDTMTVTGWVGEIPKEPSQITHIWDQNIADINSSPNPVLEDLEDDVPQPVYDEVRKFYRDNFAKILKYLNELKKAINNDLTAINKDINQTNRKSKENNDVIES